MRSPRPLPARPDDHDDGPPAGTRRDRWVLSGLRVASLVVLVLCLFRPMLLLSDAIPQRNFVAVVLDDSKSMTIADREGRARGAFQVGAFAAESTLITELRKKFDLTPPPAPVFPSTFPVDLLAWSQLLSMSQFAVEDRSLQLNDGAYLSSRGSHGIFLTLRHHSPRGDRRQPRPRVQYPLCT